MIFPPRPSFKVPNFGSVPPPNLRVSGAAIKVTNAPVASKSPFASKTPPVEIISVSASIFVAPVTVTVLLPVIKLPVFNASIVKAPVTFKAAAALKLPELPAVIVKSLSRVRAAAADTEFPPVLIDKS